MPQSWSKKKKEQMNDTPHQQTPDVDNLLKAVLDAIYDQDGVVWDIHVKKRWGYGGAICIEDFNKLNNTCGKKTMHRVDSGRIGPCENSHAKPVTKKNEKVIYGDHKLPF